MIDSCDLTQEQVLSWIENRRKQALNFLDNNKNITFLTSAEQDELEGVIGFFAHWNENLAEDGQVEDELYQALADAAYDVRLKAYGNKVFFRGLIEFTNYCQKNCYYCGIAAGQRHVHRYRLSTEDILECCRLGESLGYHSFVLQGGEDPYYNDDRLCQLITTIREHYPQVALTLSVGERSAESYRKIHEAGIDRFLLRHETATPEHYAQLHPAALTLADRLQCLTDLRKAGFQVGAGFMVGSPFQTVRNLARDLVFLQQFRPQMIGIGPFLPAGGTPFAEYAPGSVNQTLLMVALTRLLLPDSLLPATTALGSIDAWGREKAFSFGANVVMPNLSPGEVRADYALYDNKLCFQGAAKDQRDFLVERMASWGNVPDFTRGDHGDFIQEETRA